jgi:hypothetical protein
LTRAIRQRLIYLLCIAFRLQAEDLPLQALDTPSGSIGTALRNEA